MKHKLKLSALLLNAMVAFFIGSVVAFFLGATVGYIVALLIFGLGTGTQLYFGIIKPTTYFRQPGAHVNLAFMALQTEIWATDIAENIYPSNSFLNQSIDDSPFMKNKKVHLPQSGSAPSVEVNRTDLPAAITKRADTDLEYNVDEYTTSPVLIEHTEEIEVSYPMRQSILFDHVEQIRTKVAENMLIKWAATGGSNANIVRTTGTGRSPLGAGQTSNRKALTLDDMISVRRIFTGMDIPEDGRILVIDGNLYSDLLKITEFKTLEQLGSKVISDGAIGRIMGFDVFIRSSVLRYDNESTPVVKAYGSANAATDNLGALAFHKNFVRSAYGNGENGGVLIFDQQKAPQYYGDIFSALVRAGGQKRYTNERGVVSIVEATA